MGHLGTTASSNNEVSAMPYANEFATGESLPGLTTSRSVLDFHGAINIKDANEQHELPPVVTPERGHEHITRVIAIDGSTVSAAVRNGYPGAEAALLRIAAVVLDLHAIRNPNPNRIPRPSVIRRMEECDALDAVLPGCNVTERGYPDDSPRRFFRRTIYQTLQGSIERGHETLLDTLAAITADRPPQRVICPVEDCPNRQVTPPAAGEALCPCSKREPLYQTDVLGIHERFDDAGPNGQVYTLFQQVTEQLTLANILRYCEQAGNLAFIRDTAFIMDGPLAVFGSAAWLHTWMQREVERIHNRHTAAGYPGVLLIGIEKTGHFMEHLNQLDWSDHDGPKQALLNATAFAPTSEYINRHILHRPPGSNHFGRQTYYGRKILYKNRNGQHSVITTPIVNDAGRNAECVAAEAFPRLGEILGIMDELSTYLYEDGFAPLVRAHAHAAIPLKVGAEILHKMFPRT